MNSAPAAVEQAFREESGKILATLIRFLGDFDQAEEAMQDAMTTALESWPKDGVRTYRRHGLPPWLGGRRLTASAGKNGGPRSICRWPNRTPA